MRKFLLKRINNLWTQSMIFPSKRNNNSSLRSIKLFLTISSIFFASKLTKYMPCMNAFMNLKMIEPSFPSYALAPRRYPLTSIHSILSTALIYSISSMISTNLPLLLASIDSISRLKHVLAISKSFSWIFSMIRLRNSKISSHNIVLFLLYTQILTIQIKSVFFLLSRILEIYLSHEHARSSSTKDILFAKITSHSWLLLSISTMIMSMNWNMRIDSIASFRQAR